MDVFKLFETTKPEGTGIGLAVAKQMIEAHGGIIEHFPRSPRGTIFRIELPSMVPQRPSHMVLLLDSDDDFRTALAANLADDGYPVVHFARPRDLPPLTAFEQLSMLILDYQLDGENGLSFADRFHATHPKVPVVMMTTYVSHYLAAEVAARGFITLRRKLVDYGELARLLSLPH
jgi:CheY-like chemotaxis protein